MTREEHRQIIQQMMGCINPEHQAMASELLTKLTEDYEETLTTSESLTATNNQLTENNEKLREVNANLFLKVGVSNAGIQNPSNAPEPPKPENEPPSFELLFNEKGELI